MTTLQLRNIDIDVLKLAIDDVYFMTSTEALLDSNRDTLGFLAQILTKAVNEYEVCRLGPASNQATRANQQSFDFPWYVCELCGWEGSLGVCPVCMGPVIETEFVK